MVLYYWNCDLILSMTSQMCKCKSRSEEGLLVEIKARDGNCQIFLGTGLVLVETIILHTPYGGEGKELGKLCMCILWGCGGLGYCSMHSLTQHQVELGVQLYTLMLKPQRHPE
jgi:hypothetical protein